MNKKLAAALAVPVVAGAFVCAGPERSLADAGKAYRNFTQGTSASGVICADGACLIEAEKVSVFFDIQHFPQETYGGEEQFCKYGAHAVTEYSLRNPTDQALRVKLLFPFGTPPEYAVSFGENGKIVFADGAHYRVAADGAEIVPEVRHTYHGDFYYFDAQEEKERLFDGYRKDDFFSFETPVTSYTYTLENAEADPDGGSGYGFVSSFDYNRAKTRVLLSSSANLRIENGSSKVFLDCVDFRDRTFTVYAIGAPPEQAPAWQTKNGDAAGERFALLSQKNTTFGALVESGRKEESGVSCTDWYNAVVDRLNEARTDTCVVGSIEELKKGSMLSRWYEYTLEIPAGGTSVNTVTAPVYPDIETTEAGGARVPTYRYEYLLSAASCFADVGEFTVTVRTPFRLSNSTLAFEDGEDGQYVYKKDGLPHGELAFTLSDGDAALPPEAGRMSSSLLTALIILGVLCAGAIGLAAAGFVITRKKKKSK